LCEERVSPGFTYDQISPLHNHNTDEKCSVAGVLQDFTLIESLQEKTNLYIGKVTSQKPFHLHVIEALYQTTTAKATRECHQTKGLISSTMDMHVRYKSLFIS